MESQEWQKCLCLYGHPCQFSPFFFKVYNFDTEVNILYREVTKLYLIFWIQWSLNIVVLSLRSLRTAQFLTSLLIISKIHQERPHWLIFFFFLDGVKLAALVDSVSGKDLQKVDILLSSDFIDRSSVQTASSSKLTVFTFYTDDVILCMQDFVFCVSA